MKNNKFWKYLKLWLIPKHLKMCRGCCLFCTYQNQCVDELLKEPFE